MPRSLKARITMLSVLLILTTLASSKAGQQPPRPGPVPELLAPENRMAWCIVPFDSRKRGPEERAEMLQRLGFQHYAYDWRAEHLPTFDQEVQELNKRGISLDAVWFPAALNDEAKALLNVIEKHSLKTQLWITMGDPAPDSASQNDKVEAAKRILTPIAEEAARLGCRVELYNHGGWFGEPENQVEVIQAMDRPNVGIVYNLHHGHDHLERLPALLQLMMPYLDAININGMDPRGDRVGRKILPLGQGSMDLEVLNSILESGYKGPIGILGHTDDDAEQRLQDNLDGLDWLLRRGAGDTTTPRPTPRTPVPPRTVEAAGWLIPGKPEYRTPPLTVDLYAKVDQKNGFNILVASDTKQSADHWEIFTWPGTGALTAYFPGREPDHVRSEYDLADGQWHHVAMTLEPDRVRLFVDGLAVGESRVASRNQPPVPGDLAVGRLVEGGIGLVGEVAWLRIRQGILGIEPGESATPAPTADTIGLWDLGGEESRAKDQSTLDNPASRVETVSTVLQPVELSDLPRSSVPAVPAEPSPEFVNRVLEDARNLGDSKRGVLVFAAPTVACISCHKVGSQGGTVGPDLTEIGKSIPPEALVESLFWPHREVKDGYHATVLALANGQVVQGYIRNETDQAIVLFDAAASTELTISAEEVEDRRETGSLMPEGLANALPADQRRDLIRFLLDLGTTPNPPEIPKDWAVHGHSAATFPYDRAPLDPIAWPNWQAPVNRDRVYDFYAKEAAYFRQQESVPPLLPEFPGLDGGTFGHWGNQNEEVWADGRWNATNLGLLLSGIFRAGDLTVPKGVCIRLGDQGELSACFNPQSLRYEAVWSGGFVQFSPVRHGFMDGIRPVGTMKVTPGPTAPEGDSRYLGFHRAGNRVAFAYEVNGVEYLDVPWVDDQGNFRTTVLPRAEHPETWIAQGGPAQWPEILETEGELGNADGSYVVDTIRLPFDNPWNALLFVGDHDFLDDGSALLCTMQGDVWRVDGLDEHLENVRWRRVASGLNQPLGLVIVDGAPHVLGRDQITRLHDRNDDGEYDFYECVTNAYETSPAGHDFICGLQRDAAGNFYTASGNQGLIRIRPDGKTVEILATGFRNPDGLGLAPDGRITVPASEGEWTPASMICQIREGGHYGYKGPVNGRVPDLPLVYLPRGVDNSSGGQAFAPDDPRWGPLKNQLIHTSFGAGAWFAVLCDQVNGQPQGAALLMPGEFRSGAHRARFNPRDGQLYVSGMAGWGSYTLDDGSFQRVRYTGRSEPLPIAWRAHQNGVLIEFSQPIDPSVAANRRSHFAQAWNYRYGPGYGSPEYSPTHRGVRGHDPVLIASAHILEDGRSLFLEMPDLQPVNQLHLQLNVGGPRAVDLMATVHRLAPPFTGYPGYREVEKTIAAHPILVDLASTAAAKPNPWRKSIPNARPIRLEAGKNLTYSTRTLRARSGEFVRLTFANPDVVPHNWVLIRPGRLEEVGKLANLLVADPDAAVRGYVPETDDVLFYTDLVEAGGQFTISFQVPDQPGRYPYLCTFPGHWMVMNGELIVEP